MADVFPIWPRRRSAAVALAGLIGLQFVLFFAATRASFFTHEDFYHFALARERNVLHYLVTPIIHTYPAPGHRLLFLVLDSIAPLDYVAARLCLLGLLAGTTVLLGQFVRMLARSDAWWTVALLAPFAFSLTLVSPVNLWSNGVPVLPSLFFTVLAFSAWSRAYTAANPGFWVGVTVLAVAAAGAFYTKFLLLPVYLLFFRLAIFPRLLNLPAGIRPLWQERARWIALAVPPALFLSVYVLSGLAARSYIPGERPYLEYLATAWFRAFVPVSVLNVPLDGSAPTPASWTVIVGSQALFWTAVAATWARSSLALRGWMLFALAFVANLVMVGSARLPGFGIEIAYWLRYYPEVVLFLPIALAIGLCQGEERRPRLAWERTISGQATIGLLACVHVISLAIWAPRIVAASEGVQARIWFENLRRDLAAVSAREGTPRLVDSETPEYVVLSWMAPRNRVSTILGLMQEDAVYNDLVDPIYLVHDDGRLHEADFRPLARLHTRRAMEDGVRQVADPSPARLASCAADGRALHYRPDAELPDVRLALRVFYSSRSREPALLEVDTGDEYARYRVLQMRPSITAAELLDLGAARLQTLKVESAPGDVVCIERIEVGVFDGRR